MSEKLNTRTFLKRGEGLKKRFGVDPEQFRLNNLPKYKYTKPKSKACETSVHRKNIKTSKVINKTDRFEEEPISFLTKNINKNSTEKCIVTDSPAYSNSKESPPFPLLWSQVLKSQGIEAVSMPTMTTQDSLSDYNDTSLNLFELVEKKINLNKTNITPLKPSSKKNSSDNVLKSDKSPQKSLKTETFEESYIKKIEELKSKRFSGIDALLAAERLEISRDNSLSHETSIEEEESSDQNCQDEEYINETDKISDTADFEIPLIEQLTKMIFAAMPKEKEEEEEENVLAENVEIDKPPPDTNTVTEATNNFTNDESIKMKSTQMYGRLADLEREIESLKKKNLSLSQLREDMELEKMKFDEEQAEMYNRLQDERTKFEIYMHDEQMKLNNYLENSEQKNERKRKSAEQKMNMELKKEIEDLRRLLEKKDQAYQAAQKRLRTKLLNLEKENNVLQQKLETLFTEFKAMHTRNMHEKQLSNIKKRTRNSTSRCSKDNIENKSPEKKSSQTHYCKHNLTTPKSFQHDNSLQSSNKQHLYNRLQDTNTNISLEADSIMEEIYELNNQNTKSNSTKYSEYNDERKRENEDNVVKNIDRVVQSIEKTDNNVQTKQSTENRLTNNVSEENNNCNMKREICNPDGSKEIWYPNGNVKKISADGMIVRMLYFNHDIKETDVKIGMVKYYYASKNIWHTTYIDGLEILEFPNGQTEHHHKNGLVEVYFPNDAVKKINPTAEDNCEEWNFSNGTKLLQKGNGDRVLILPNGETEEHTKLCRKRLYPDGTIKLVFPDGSQETRYSNGRIRLKDKKGNIIVDTIK